jgi:hypothetical protein
VRMRLALIVEADGGSHESDFSSRVLVDMARQAALDRLDKAGACVSLCF